MPFKFAFAILCSFLSQFNLLKYFKINLSESVIPGALLNGRLPVYKTYLYRPRLDATRFQVILYLSNEYIFQIPAHFIGNEESLSTNPEKLVRK